MKGSFWNKLLKILIGFLIILTILWVTGPKPDKANEALLQPPTLTADLKELEDSINLSESKLDLKPDNQARIVWAKPHEITEYSIVYLHGNAASQEEGDPMHEAIAARYGCNLYLARLADHGLNSSDPMLNITVQDWLQSALDAIQIGKMLGKKVIVMSCSTGSTLALYISSLYPNLIDAHLLLSPNIDLYDSRSFLLAQPWGLQMGKAIIGSDYYSWSASKPAENYWYLKYRLEGLTVLKTMIRQTMQKETFEKISSPVFMSYYHKDAEHEDMTVSVPAMNRMFDWIKTPEAFKRNVAIPDANTHIIGCDIFNRNLNSLWSPLTSYCEEVLKLPIVLDIDYTPFLDNR